MKYAQKNYKKENKRNGDCKQYNQMTIKTQCGMMEIQCEKKTTIFTINRSQGTPAPAFSGCQNMGEFLHLMKHQFTHLTNGGRPCTLKRF